MKDWGVLLKGGMFSSLLGTLGDRPGIWAPPVLGFFPVVFCQLSQCSGMWHSACKRHQNGAGAQAAILSSTQLGSPQGRPLDWGILSSGLQRIRQEIQAGSDKEYKTRAG